MIPLSAKRIEALLRRYGQPALLRGETDQTVRVLINDSRPISHPDLPDESIVADGLVLAQEGAPTSGDALLLDQSSWLLHSAIPLDAAATLFQVQLSQRHRSTP